MVLVGIEQLVVEVAMFASGQQDALPESLNPAVFTRDCIRLNAFIPAAKGTT